MTGNAMYTGSTFNSWMCGLDPRAKIIGIFTLLFSILSVKAGENTSLIFYGGLILCLFFSTRVPVSLVLKKIAVLVPIIVMISSLIPFSMHKTLEENSMGLWQEFGFMIFKAFLGVMCMFLLMYTTLFPDLLKGLEKMGAPRLIVMIMSFMYRYFFVIQDIFIKMNQARESRSSGRCLVTLTALGKRQLEAASGMAGVLFLRSYEKANSVYLAMCSRGFRGHITTMNHLKFHDRDYVFMFGAFLAAIFGKWMS